MANPQVEEGHTEIANTLYEALCRAELPGRELRLIHAVIRKTYGWKRKWAEITAEEFTQLTGIKERSHLSALTSSLAAKNIVWKRSTPGRATAYKLNKDYDTWCFDVTPQGITAESITPGGSTEESITVEGVTGTTPESITCNTPECSTSPGRNTLLDIKKGKEKERKDPTDAVLLILQGIKGYPFDPKTDTEHIARLKADFSAIDLLEVVKDYRDWVLDHPIARNGSPRSRLRNFCRKAQEWANQKQPSTGGNGHRPPEGSGKQGSSSGSRDPRWDDPEFRRRMDAIYDDLALNKYSCGDEWPPGS